MDLIALIARSRDNHTKPNASKITSEQFWALHKDLNVKGGSKPTNAAGILAVSLHACSSVEIPWVLLAIARQLH
jgi:hypothetical protein